MNWKDRFPQKNRYFETERGILYQGDCLKIMPMFPKNTFDAIITDPPFGITQCQWDSVISLKDMWLNLKRIRKERAPIVLFSKGLFTGQLIMSNPNEFKYYWIWVKEQGIGNLNAKKRPLVITEEILVFYKKQCKYNPQMRKGNPYRIIRQKNKAEFLGKNGTHNNYTTVNNGYRYPVNLIYAQRELKNRYHPTQKPLVLMEYLIKTYTSEGDLVIDFTSGSGSTLVACEKLNRHWIGIELNEKYCKVTKNRLLEIKNEQRI